jgi:hypothetical protein
MTNPSPKRARKVRTVKAWAFTYRYPRECLPNVARSGIVIRAKYLYYDGILDALSQWHASSRAHGTPIETGDITTINLPAPIVRKKK